MCDVLQQEMEALPNPPDEEENLMNSNEATEHTHTHTVCKLFSLKYIR